jgi:4-amino-4-deoxy-L-arabinose transferase-like glycosyltransferase
VNLTRRFLEPHEAEPAPTGEARPAVDHRLLLLLVAVLGVLALFVGKAFTIDDPLFLWLAQHVQSEPLNFYDYLVNWQGTVRPMYEVTKNPPLVGYYIAAVAAVVGWSEVALHAAFLPAGALAAVGTFLLARRFTRRPLEAGLAALLSPVFLVSSTNLMCDTTMLALWCASIVCWIRGFDTGSQGWRLASGVLIAIAFLTKYFAIALVPLLIVYGALRERRAGRWILPLLVPMAVVLAYDGIARVLYGHALFLNAAIYPSTMAGTPKFSAQALVGLAFAGGCTIAALIYAPLLWSRRTLAIAWVLLVLVMFDPGEVREVMGISVILNPQWSWILDLQLFLLALGGVSVAGLAITDLWHHRTPESVLLALWVLGTLVFASFINWTNNGRSNLVLAPAVGILLVRRLDALTAAGWAPGTFSRIGALGAAVLVALGVAWADYRWANDVRDAARSIGGGHERPGRVTYANGNWGFQYYMEKEGVRTIDLNRDVLERGDALILLNNNTNPRFNPKDSTYLIDEYKHPEGRWLYTNSTNVGAGFYSSAIGPIPYAFARGLPDEYKVWRVTRSFRLVPADLGDRETRPPPGSQFKPEYR